MELDDLKATWKSIDRRLEMQNDLQLRIYRDGKLDKARLYSRVRSFRSSVAPFSSPYPHCSGRATAKSCI
jgi:hypothetical protein